MSDQVNAAEPPASESGRWTKFQKGELFVISIALAVIFVARVWMRFPAAVEHYYVEGPGAAISRFLSTLTAPFPFSVGEALLAGVILFVSGSFIRGIHRLVRRKTSLTASLLSGVLTVVTLATVAVALFYANWGIAYARPAAVERLHWASFRQNNADHTAELVQLCGLLVNAVNEHYRSFAGGDDLKNPSLAPSGDVVNSAIEEGYRKTAEVLDLDPGVKCSRGLAKRLLIGSYAMSYSHLSGIYCPWTGEANYNRLVPECRVPHLIAHEKAHQRLFTSEDEANFFGFLACVNSPDTYVQYSGLRFALGQLLEELAKLDKEKALALRKDLLPGVKVDDEANRQFWDSYTRSRIYQLLGRHANTFNDAYLKLNGVKKGVVSYQLSAELLILLARSHGPEAIVGKF
jgi:hypothetical protein